MSTIFPALIILFRNVDAYFVRSGPDRTYQTFALDPCPRALPGTYTFSIGGPHKFIGGHHKCVGGYHKFVGQIHTHHVQDAMTFGRTNPSGRVIFTRTLLLLILLGYYYTLNYVWYNARVIIRRGTDKLLLIVNNKRAAKRRRRLWRRGVRCCYARRDV